MPTMYLSPTGSGNGSGADWGNAARLTDLNAMITAAGPGGTVLLRADQGAYAMNSSVDVTSGGAAGASVTVMGVDGAGNPMNAQIVGTRTAPYDVNGNKGLEVFRLLEGADHLSLQYMSFENIGAGAIRVGAPISDLTVGNMEATNVQRFFENFASSGRSDATITGLTIHDVSIRGYSKGAIRVQYDSSDILIRDVIGNSDAQDGDMFAIGLAFDGTAHDALIQRVEMFNSRDTASIGYWNGDGFVTELGNYDIAFEQVVATGNTDGGFDLKSQSTTIRDVISLDNGHSFRLWDYAVSIENVIAGETNLHGGSGLPASIWMSRGASDWVRDGFFIESDPTTPIFDLRYGNQTLTLQDVYTVGAVPVVAAGGSTVAIQPGSGLTTYRPGSAGDETIVGGALRDIIHSAGGNDRLFGADSGDQLIGGDGNDLLDGGSGEDLLYGGSGDDTYIIDSVNDLMAELVGEGTDLVVTSLDSYRLRANTENLTATTTGSFAGYGNELDNRISSGSGNDTLSGDAGNDTLDGGGGADRMTGGLGDDVYVVDDVGDVVIERPGGGTDTIRTGLSSDTLPDQVEAILYTGNGDFTGTGNALDNFIIGGAGRDTLVGLDGNDTLDGAAGADLLVGGSGNDTYRVDTASDAIVEDAGGGFDLVLASAAAFTLGANLENLTFIGSGDFGGTGNHLDNRLVGGGGNDTLLGLGGNDTLVGGAGGNQLIGGLGDDTYEVGSAADTVVEAPGEGSDLVRTALVSYTLGANLERLTFTGTGAFAGTGNALDNVLTGGDGNDTLDGAGGGDLLVGGLGDDIYVVDDASDVVAESPGGGWDIVRTSLSSYDLGLDVEGLAFTRDGNVVGRGNALDNAMTAGAGNDALMGLAGNDVLDGGSGDDVLTGGTGDDTYVVDSAGDVVVEAVSEGNDTIRTALSGYTLGDNLENLVATGSSGFSGTGNALDNCVTGGAGADTLLGLDGNDVLDGGEGADTLIGGAGDDKFIVDDAGDVIVERAFEGTDLVWTTLGTYTLSDEVERLVFVGTGAFRGTGNALDNTITGGAGDDTLDGAAGADVLVGGAGNDIYLVRDGDGPDTIVEAAGQGIDTVVTTGASYVLGAEIERLVGLGSASFTGTGNGLDNTIVAGVGSDTLDGQAGDDTLDGGAGDDTMVGGAGNDTFIVDSAQDVVIEYAGGGTDTVRVAIAAYALAANVEALVYTGTAAFAGTGNDGDNLFVGGAGNDTLDGGRGNDVLTGGAGADRLIGGAGDDTYDVDDAGDVVVENDGEGTDLVRTTLGSATLAANVENLTFVGTGNFAGTGNERDNVITGGAGNDTLTGGAGNDYLMGGGGTDRLVGGLGDDVYEITKVGATLVEAAGEGIDLVLAGLASYALGANIENLTYTGTVAFSGTGNALANILTGGAGNDTLTGGGGADTLIGGAGSDTAAYVASASAVTVSLQSGSGSGGDAAGDILSGIENLTGSGFADTLSGDDGANALRGGNGNDLLSGLGGNDTLIGQGGDDTLSGGTGNDTYVVENAGDVVVENAGEGTDLVQTALAGYVLTAHVENLTFTGGAGSFAGTGNALDNAIVGGTGNDTLNGLAGNDTLDGGAGSDRLDGGIGDDTLNGRAGADTLIGSEGTDTATYANSTAGVTVSVAAGTGAGGDAAGDTLSGIENLTGSNLADVLVGDGGVNVLAGGNGADILDGNGGADTLIGGIGDDIFIVANAGVTIVELAGQGNDILRTTLNAYTLDAFIEDLTFTGTGDFTGLGNTLNNVMRGGAGNDVLIGGTGEDVMIGGAGNDSYDVDNASDKIIERADEGIDTVSVSRSRYTLSAHIENLISKFAYIGGTSFTGFGNDLDNVLVGGSGTDWLDGETGADTLIGGLGDDNYYVDSPDDVIVEDTGAGYDYVRVTATTYRLSANVERMQYTGAGSFVGYGNDLDNLLNSGDGDDTLYGGAGNDSFFAGNGNDTLYGGTGDDSYRIESTDDRVIEAAGEGTDLIRTTLNRYVLPDNVENLSFAGGPVSFSGTGNALANAITGGSGQDVLDGGAGADTLTGAAGNDTYIVDDPGDVVVELVNGGIDTVRTTLAGYWLADNVDTLVFVGLGSFSGVGNALDNAMTGGAGADTLDAKSGNDTLDGGAGADRMIGGLGDDTFLVDDARDIVVENTGEGTDVVVTGLSSYTLAAHVEQLRFVGTGAFVGSGNELANTLTGGSGNDLLDGKGGNDLLDGGLGSDTLTGGMGDDTYLVDDVGDSVVEGTSAGTDTVLTGLSSYTLAKNLENLTYTGSDSFTGTGNTVANTLTGGAGNDTLDGGSGADILVGNRGDDTYLVDNAADRVVEESGGGIDTILSRVSYTLSDNVENLTLATTSSLNATGNGLDNTLVGNAGLNVLDGGAGHDVLTGLGNNDTFVFRLGQADGDVVTDFTGAGLTRGDVVMFVGYGNATITRSTDPAHPDHYIITPDATHGGAAETIQITGVTNLDLLTGGQHNDIVFV
ncbi:Ca2+-binding RTX toxin-like protein [Methylorubrum rhodesianum]|uniref:RTX toxin n=1 Tax=Methylorubrum TaxID=2282523 RepID=UPI001810CA00|nr:MULTISPECIES: RTX toxin [Methylorubrum]MBB5765749.1 Ca2+-binding RTX toxin-like protein [Methylorubrum rhodesianum]